VVVWSLSARNDLRAIYDQIAGDSIRYAKRVVRNIVGRTEMYALHPKMGKGISEVEDEMIRELSAYSYRIIYQIADPDIVVLAIVHKRRDFLFPFDDDT